MTKKKKLNERTLTFLLITIPVLALFFCFNTLPLLKGFAYSFTNFKGYGSYDMVGLRNYIDLFQDARVGKSYLFTFKFALVSTLIVNVFSLVLALGLNSNIKGKSALRGFYFIPNILGGLVVGYFQLSIHLCSAGGRVCGRDWLPQQEPALQHQNGMVCHRVGLRLAVHRHEYHHLYLRASDCAGGCI